MFHTATARPFYRLRRAEPGITTISPAATSPPMPERWRGGENNRRVSNGAQYLGVTAAALNAPGVAAVEGVLAALVNNAFDSLPRRAVAVCYTVFVKNGTNGDHTQYFNPCPL